MSNRKQIFTAGIFRENPIFIIMLGLCPTLAVSTQVWNAIGMGMGVIFVLVGSNVFIALLKSFIPDSIRIPSYIVIIASFVTILEMLLHAYMIDLYNALGIYLSLIVVNCIILGRAEAFASKNTVLDSALDGLGMGIGFTLGLTLIAFIREVIGSGTITLINLGETKIVFEIPGYVNAPVKVIALSAGALLVMGYLKAFFTWKTGHEKKGKGEKIKVKENEKIENEAEEPVLAGAQVTLSKEEAK